MRAPATDVDDSADVPEPRSAEPADDDAAETEGVWTSEASPPPREISDDSLVNAKQSLVDAVDELVGVLGSAEVRAIGATDRANLAKYLTIAKLRLENAIAMVRSEDGGN